MINRKRLFWATTAIVGTLAGAGAASAQSTGTQATEVDEVVVTGARGPRNVDGLAVAQQVGKSRSTVTQEYLSTQTPGQTVLQSLNLQPGVNFTNQDPYGASGGDITIRGFDAQRISLNLDGIQLNDTGNYQIYSNQQVDPELIDRATVNQGTTDVDSPTASATGGTINFVSRRPAEEFGAIVQPSFGTDNYRRFFGLVDTGAIGPWGTTAYVAYSATKYDQFNNPGKLNKQQWNGRIYQPIGDEGDFASVSFNYNENRNNSYGGKNVDDFNNGIIGAGNTDICNFDAPRAGVRDNQGTSNTTTNVGCGSYYNYFMNPSDTGNIRGQLRYSLTDRLTLTVDPTFQYTLANGGGTTVINETDQRLQGTRFNLAAPTANGVDLNGDGDILDSIRLYSPSNTNTRRYSINASLIYDLNDDHRLRVAYTYDRGFHRQTGEYGYLDRGGNPMDPFSGKKGHGEDILTLDGNVFQKRNRRSIAELNQVAFQYVGNFLEDALTLDIGVRVPYFSRDLVNYCYQINTFDAFCSTQQPTGSAANLAAGAPTTFERKYDDVLPNVGATWRFATSQQVFASYSENLSAPRTDDLYDRVPANPAPETTKNYDIGYRYQTSRVVASVSAYYSQFENYIARGFTELEGGETITTNINVGGVDRKGFDGSIGFFVTPDFSLFGSASYLDSEIKNNLPTGAGAVTQIKGNRLFEVPEWQYAARTEYTLADATFGLQAKWVDKRYTNLVNDEETPSYTVVDFDFRYDLSSINDGMFFQLNVDNLFDEEYLGNISTEVSGNRTAQLGSPRSVVGTLRLTF